MVHLRLNEKEATRNPHINFIRALSELPDEDEALTRLTQLAALFRPIMKEYGFTINSLVEHEYNKEFAGRNWNAGETIEMVLRKPNGDWFSPQAVVSVMAHELAHIKHMNHLPPHGRLTAEIRGKAMELMRGGYHGDGFWSSGFRLSDGMRQRGDAEVNAEVLALAQSLCGGAMKGARRKRTNRDRSAAQPGQSSGVRSRNKQAGPSARLGAQTSKNLSLTASKRVRKALPGEGARVDGAILPEANGTASGSAPYSSKRRRMQSDSERTARAQAAERRLQVVTAERQDAHQAESPSRTPQSRHSASDKKAPIVIDLLDSSDNDNQ